MENEIYSDEDIANILKATKTIAVVGGSPERNRPSYSVMQFLQKRGYRIVPVNPRATGQTILGEKVYASLADIPFPIDMVDIFRTSDAAGQISDEAVATKAKFVWMQLGVRNPAAAERARAAGLQVIMDRCSKIEYGRLSGQIGFMGVDTGIINNSRRRRV